MSESTQAVTGDPAPEAPTPEVSRRRRGLAIAGQVAAGAGLVVSLLLIIVVLVGRGWVVGTVDDVESSINAALGRATPAVATAQGLVGEVGQKMTDLATAADAVVADTNTTPAALVPLQQRLASASERYLALRDAYAGFRAEVVSVGDRLALIRRVVPGDVVPQGPTEALAAFDERVRALDERVMRVVNAGAADTATDAAATAIASAAREAEASIAAVSDALAAVDTKVVELQGKVTSTAATAETVVTISTVVLVLLLVYIAFLNVVLFRASVLYGDGRPA